MGLFHKSKKRIVIKAISFTVFFFTLLVWLYIASSAIVNPETITVRENTLAIICFVISLVSFFIWNLVKESIGFSLSL